MKLVKIISIVWMLFMLVVSLSMFASIAQSSSAIGAVIACGLLFLVCGMLPVKIISFGMKMFDSK